MKEYTLETIIEAVEENNEMNGGTWTQWDNAEHIITTIVDGEHYFLADEVEYDEMVSILNTRIINARNKLKEDYFVMKPMMKAVDILTQSQVDKIGHFDYWLYKDAMINFIEDTYNIDFYEINSFMVDKSTIENFAIIYILRCVNKK